MSALPPKEYHSKPNVIVGMGPGGLVAAIELVKKGENVLILENREEFTRMQKVALTPKTLSYLFSLFGPGTYDASGRLMRWPNSPKDPKASEFIEELRKSSPWVEISTLQDYLKGRLLALIELQKTNPSLYGKAIIKQNKNIKLEKVEAGKQILKFNEGDLEHTVAFKHLIAADGARRQTAELAAKDGTLPISYKKYDKQIRQGVHGTINVELDLSMTEADVKEGQKKMRELNSHDLPILQKLGWDKPYLPKIYITPDSTGRKIYIAGEIPASYLKLSPETKQKALETLAKTLLELQCKYPKDKVSLNLYKGKEDTIEAKLARERDKLKTTVFPVTLEYTTKNAIDCSPDHGRHTFIQIGDAARSANFYLGHGTNDAIADGIAVGKNMGIQMPDGSFQRGLFNISAFTAHHEHLKSELISKMELMEENFIQKYLKMHEKTEENFLLNLKTTKTLAKDLFISNPDKKVKITKNLDEIKEMIKKMKNENKKFTKEIDALTEENNKLDHLLTYSSQGYPLTIIKQYKTKIETNKLKMEKRMMEIKNEYSKIVHKVEMAFNTMQAQLFDKIKTMDEEHEKNLASLKINITSKEDEIDTINKKLSSWTSIFLTKGKRLGFKERVKNLENEIYQLSKSDQEQETEHNEKIQKMATESSEKLHEFRNLAENLKKLAQLSQGERLSEALPDQNPQAEADFSKLYKAVNENSVFSIIDSGLLTSKKAAVNINRADKNGMTLLMISARNGNPKITRMLLEAGAEVNLKNSLGKTALDLANINVPATREQEAVIELIKKAFDEKIRLQKSRKEAQVLRKVDNTTLKFKKDSADKVQTTATPEITSPTESHRKPSLK